MKKTIYFIALLLLVISCQKDDFSGNTIENPNGLIDDVAFIENFGASTTSNFIGRVVNENGTGVKDVLISIGSLTTLTDHNGVFVLNGAPVYEKFAYITADKSGYIKGSRTIVPAVSGFNDIQIVLLEKNVVGVISSGTPSEVSLPNGAKVSFQGEFIDASGNPYSGQVEVSMHYLQPNQETTFAQMPGMLFAQDNSNNPRSLETYGMMSVNLFSPSGEELNILESSPATLEFPVDVSTSNASDSIELWYFDEDLGYWKEQGQATKIGNKYTAEVTHFTWWNCDLPLDYVNICFSIETTELNRIANKRIEIIRNATDQVIFSGFTNENGEDCGLFPANEEVTISVLSPCNSEVIYSQVLGPYSSDTSISITNPSLPSEILETNITGTFTSCSGAPIENGYMFIFSGNDSNLYQSIQVPVDNGTVNYPLLFCSGESYSYLVYDMDNNQSTTINSFVLNESVTNLGSLSACQENGGMHVGDVVLETQEEVNRFGLLNYSAIQGSLTIGINNSAINDIVSLTPLQGLSFVTGGLSIDSNDQLTSLNGLQNLETNTLSVTNNDALVSLEGLNSITSLSTQTNIHWNDSLISLNGLNNLTTSNGLILIIGNNSLESLDGLESLNEVYLIKIGNAVFYSPSENPNLTDFCALQNLVVNGTYEQIEIAGNLYNPSVQDIIDGNCAQ
ncbi:hypothetical protein [Pseudofulvibacter geojedonensis]|uniref:Receptor L-domain domain-containing protein n=1 Tax=Pseudofulvibacter geojedonensis TaxID=1123758 RepID=A0ABW3I0Y4_9FLAO